MTKAPRRTCRKEAFQPIAIRPPSEGRLLFAIRCLVDLQLLTTFRFLRRELKKCQGHLIDVGAGHAPWRELAPDREYTEVDIDSADAFGMARQPGVPHYDGLRIPIADASVENVLTSEVLEHVPDEHLFMADIARILRPEGTLILTIPWSARLHHLLHDYRRLSPSALTRMLHAHGLVNVMIEDRDSAVSVRANKRLVQTIPFFRTPSWRRIVLLWPLALLGRTVAFGFLAASHLALELHLGSREDPLGYGLVAKRTTASAGT